MLLIIRLFGLLLPLLLRVIMDRILQRFMICMITFTTACYCDNFQKRVEWGYRIKFPGSFPGLPFSILFRKLISDCFSAWLSFREYPSRMAGNKTRQQKKTRLKMSSWKDKGKGKFIFDFL